ncbi:hypothetical protein GW17_00029166 [Ensete ventricosum]|nr:hypothetical protein GW17_00029166 [Ensete ventricosum]
MPLPLPLSLLSPERPRAWFGRLDYVADTIAAVVSLRCRHCSRWSSSPSLLLAAVTAVACRYRCRSSRLRSGQLITSFLLLTVY